MARSKGKEQRDRGRTLTDIGLEKIWGAIYIAIPDRQTFAAIAQHTERSSNPQAITSITAETISKVLQRKRGVDISTLENLFTAFGLTLQDADHTSIPRIGWTDRFVGRDTAMADLDRLVEQFNAKAILIIAPGGVGKTTLAEYWLQQHFDEKVLKFYIAKDIEGVDSAESWVQEQLRRLGEDPVQEYGIALERLRKSLRQEPMGVLVDNLEPTLNPMTGDFLPQQRPYRRLLQMLTDPQLQSVTLLTSREPLTGGIDLERYDLAGLSHDAWCYCFEQWGITMEPRMLRTIHHFYGGNALVMKKLRYPIQKYAQGNLLNYWQQYQPQDAGLEKNIQNFLIEQFDRLQACPNAYKLLCRMSCFRFQDLPRVPLEALFAVQWDVQETQRLTAIKELQERGLVEWEEAEFWLHPYIREYAIRKLRNNKEEHERCHLESANFWRKKGEETVEDISGFYIFESFYHFLEIKNLKAIQEIPEVQPHENYYMYRVKAVQECTSAFFTNYKDLSVHAYLNNIKGKFFIITGKINQGLRIHEELRRESIKRANFLTLAETEITIGFCNLYLYEIEESARNFQNCLNALDQCNSIPQEYYVWAKCGVAYSYALLDKVTQRDKLSSVQAAMDTYSSSNLAGWKKPLAAWGIGEALIALGRLEEAKKMHESNYQYCDTQAFFQIRGKSLTALGTIARMQGQYENSLTYLESAITGLRKIWAYSDLPEAYFQCALTHKAMNNMAKSKECLNTALEMWSPQQMDAPNQIIRVEQTTMV